MAGDAENNLRLEIRHVLFIDLVGYSKLSIEEQKARLNKLTEVVLATPQVAETSNEQLVRLPTGDGVALVFRNSAEEPAQCALEIAQALKAHPEVAVRMGIHSGPVSEVTDVSGRTNITGGGMNMAQRVMDCGDAGHILLSKHVADDLGEYEYWRPLLSHLGECEVKHGTRASIVNLVAGDAGNPQLPKKFQALKNRRARTRLAAAAAGVLLLLAALIFFPKKSPRLESSVSEKSIAVLPLENLSDEKENAFFADGIQEELLSDLGKIKELKVISRTSVMQYKTGITRNLKEIAQQLGVGNVVEGSVRRSGNHIRVTVQLIDALTDRHIWSQNYDRTLADSLALQGELATEIAAGVGATLSPQEKMRVETKPTDNPAAYDAYLRGRAFAAGSGFNRRSVEGAIQSYQEAVRLDPNFALAWAYLSCAQSGDYWDGLDPTAARLNAAKDALDRAVALQPDLPETHLAFGYFRYYGLRDFAGALTEFQLAEKNLPNNVDALKAIGLIHRRFGHWDEAVAALRRVVELDPRNSQSAGVLAVTYMSIRHFSDALVLADRILAVDPANTGAIHIKAICLWAMGNVKAVETLLANPAAEIQICATQHLINRRYPEAIDLLSKALIDEPDAEKKDTLSLLGLAQQRAGNTAAAKAAYEQAAQEIKRELEEVAPESAPAATLHSALGIAYAGSGEAALAVAEGQKGIAMQPTSKDPFEGPSREEDMANIYASLGDADHAIPILQRLLKTFASTDITPALLRIDPGWDLIRNDPRFQKLCEETPP